MDICSLEEDNYNGMFITQSDKVLNGNVGGSIGGMRGENIVAAESGIDPVYSDISDNDFVDFPLSQNSKNSSVIGERYVLIVYVIWLISNGCELY